MSDVTDWQCTGQSNLVFPILHSSTTKLIFGMQGTLHNNEVKAKYQSQTSTHTHGYPAFSWKAVFFNAVLTSEIELHPSEIILFERVKTCLKLFHNYFTCLLQLTNTIFQHVCCCWNNFKTPSAAEMILFPFQMCFKMILFHL